MRLTIHVIKGFGKFLWILQDVLRVVLETPDAFLICYSPCRVKLIIWQRRRWVVDAQLLAPENDLTLERKPWWEERYCLIFVAPLWEETKWTPNHDPPHWQGSQRKALPLRAVKRPNSVKFFSNVIVGVILRKEKIVLKLVQNILILLKSCK